MGGAHNTEINPSSGPVGRSGVRRMSMVFYLDGGPSPCWPLLVPPPSSASGIPELLPDCPNSPQDIHPHT